MVVELVLGITGTSIGIISFLYSAWQAHVHHTNEIEQNEEIYFNENINIFIDFFRKINHIFRLFEIIYNINRQMENNNHNKKDIREIFNNKSHIDKIKLKRELISNNDNNNNNFKIINDIIKIHYTSLNKIIDEFENTNKEYIYDKIFKILETRFNKNEKPQYEKINNLKYLKYKRINNRKMKKICKEYINEHINTELKKTMEYNLNIFINYYENNASNVYEDLNPLINNHNIQKYIEFITNKYSKNLKTKKEFNKKISYLKNIKTFEEKYSFIDIYTELRNTIIKILNYNTTDNYFIYKLKYYNPNKIFNICDNIRYPEMISDEQIKEESIKYKKEYA
jgi:hypothetical protein